MTPTIFPFSAFLFFLSSIWGVSFRVAAAATIKFCDDVSEMSSLRHAPPPTQVIGLEINCVADLLLKHTSTRIKSISGIPALTNVDGQRRLYLERLWFSPSSLSPRFLGSGDNGFRVCMIGITNLQISLNNFVQCK